jgi:hypothetical protein
MVGFSTKLQMSPLSVLDLVVPFVVVVVVVVSSVGSVVSEPSRVGYGVPLHCMVSEKLPADELSYPRTLT